MSPSFVEMIISANPVAVHANPAAITIGPIIFNINFVRSCFLFMHTSRNIIISYGRSFVNLDF